MTHPNLAAVEAADHLTLARWMRHLPSPGEWAVGLPEFNEVLEAEAAVQSRISDRFQEMGGWNPALSKAVGW